MKNATRAAFGALLLSVMTGCAGLTDGFEEEQETTPDITLTVLEKKMLNARDPDGIFLRAKSYVQKQIVTVGKEKVLVEVKYMAPDKFKIVYMQDNTPSTGIILNGDSAWFVNYAERRVTPITGEKLFQLKTFYNLGNPDDSYQDLFRQVKLTQCRIGAKEYYKMICQSKLPDQPPLSIYVNKNSFLIYRISIAEPVDYQSTIDRYSLYEGVMIPEETVIRQQGRTSSSKIYYNKLDASIEPAEFLPPVFPPQEEEE